MSGNNVKCLSLGKDHGLMVDEANQIFAWGKNNDGQLGLGHTRKVNSIVVLDQIKNEIKSVFAKENKSYLLTNTGKVFEWPVRQGEEIIFKPSKIRLEKTQINTISAGVDFIMMLASNGVLYAQGNNDFGELGLGDYQPRTTPEKV